ncbi:MAG: hypothetical protein Q4F95_15805 [Oscillospiraceae bacterium]|nr:hypothetical protein [Oscillospiraceae bacterium]
MKKYDFLSLASALMALTSSLIGLFYSFGGESREVLTHTGLNVKIFGDGIYKNDTLMKAATTKGTDAAIIIFSVLLIILVFNESRSKKLTLVKTGILSSLLYNSICLTMGVTINSLFALYIAMFSATLFSFIRNFTGCLAHLKPDKAYADKKHIGSIVFLTVSGCSVLIWLTFIIPAMVSGDPYSSIETLEIYCSEPTFVLDLGVILPCCIICATGICKRKNTAFILSSVLYTGITAVGICVICQTFMQMSLGIIFKPGQYIGLVGTFVILGGISAAMNTRVLRALR